MPAVAGVGVGLREHRVEARDAGVRDEPLRPVEDVLVAVPPGGRAHRRRVGAGAGLGQRVRAQQLAGREPRQPALLLLPRARELEPERAELLHGEDQPARRADLRHLLDRDEREQRAGAGAAPLLVEEQAEDALLAEELDDVPRELVRLVDLGRPRARCARGRACARARGARAARSVSTSYGHASSLVRGSVADGLDVVAVGIEDEGAVVVLVVVVADPGRAVVGPAGGERGRVERVHRRPVGRSRTRRASRADRLPLRRSRSSGLPAGPNPTMRCGNSMTTP